MDEKRDHLIERIKQLEGELSALKKRMNSLERELRENKQTDAFGLLQTKAVEPKKITKEQAEVPPQTKHQAIKEEAKPVASKTKEQDSSFLHKEVKQPEKVRESRSLEQVLGIWLPRVFMVVLILGVLWGLKIGMDHGLISYGMRIVLGYLVTVFLFVVGLRSVRKGHAIFGITLYGGVVAIGILVTMAGFYLYDLFSYPVAFLIGLVYIVAGLGLSLRNKSETLTVLSGFAGFLLPYLIVGGEPETWTFCLYLIILFLALFYIAIRLEHRISYSIVFVFFHLSLLFYSFNALADGDDGFVVGTVLIQHLLLLTAYVRGFVARHIFSEAVIYTNVVFVIAWIAILDEKTLLYGLLASLYVALAAYMYKKADDKFVGIFSAIAVFAISACILSVSFERSENTFMLLLVNGTVGLWVGLRFKTLRTIVISSFLYGMTGLSVLLVGLDAFVSLAHLTWLVFLLTIAIIYLTLYRYGPSLWKFKVKNLDGSLIGGQVVLLVYTYLLTELMFTEQRSYAFLTVFEHIQVAILVLVALCFLFAYKWRHGKYLSIAAGVEFLIFGFFLLILPLADPDVLTYFYTTFVIELLYYISLPVLLYILWRWKVPQFQRLLHDMSIIAFIMQLIYFYLLHKWYFAFVDLYIVSSEFIYLGHTIWMFLFAFLSISLGIRLNWNLVKIIGFILIGVCLIKLFFIDLVNLSIIVRAVLFMVVGAIGLVYSRFLLKNSDE